MATPIVHPRNFAGDSYVAIWLTPVLAAFYEAHGLFPELLAMEPTRMVSKTRIVAAPLELGELVLKDAEQRYRNRLLLPRGMAVSFSALIDRLRQEIKTASGIWDDPGPNEAWHRQCQERAVFGIGQRVRLHYYAPAVDDDDKEEDDEEEDDQGAPLFQGDVLTVVGGFSLTRAVCLERGEYVCEDGNRLSYKPGYLVRTSDGRDFFYPPHALRTLDNKPGHLRLVCSGGRNV